MTLNTLLSPETQSQWTPIVPDRRHSMPSPHNLAIETDPQQSSSALQTLVTNLRAKDAERTSEMLEQRSATTEATTDAALVQELVNRVDGLSSSLERRDADLARLLTILLSHLNRLSAIHSSPSTSSSQSYSWSPVDGSSGAFDPFGTLRKHLNTFQVERQAGNGAPAAPPGSTPVLAVESAMLWSKIDEELEQVMAMCKQHTDDYPMDHLPPQYYDDEMDNPPDYDAGGRVSFSSMDDKKQRTSYDQQQPASAISNEKMRMEFEAVTMAIDRLYMTAPQLHNQRVELKSSKAQHLEKLERERREGTAQAMSAKARGKQRQEDDIRDLENMLELVAKASERSLKDQSVILNGGMQARLERARQRDQSKVLQSSSDIVLELII